MRGLPRSTLVFCLFIKIFISIIASFVTMIAFNLTQIDFNLLVILANDNINSNGRGFRELILQTMVQISILFRWSTQNPIYLTFTSMSTITLVNGKRVMGLFCLEVLLVPGFIISQSSIALSAMEITFPGKQKDLTIYFRFNVHNPLYDPLSVI